jgi:hypothetical protein
MKTAFLLALFPVAVYVACVEFLRAYYETGLASGSPGVGTVLAGALSGLLAWPGAEVLERLGVDFDNGRRVDPSQIFIATTAAMLYLTLVPLVVVSRAVRRTSART